MQRHSLCLIDSHDVKPPPCMLESLLEILCEILLQGIFEALAELGLRSLVGSFSKPPNAWLSAIGYVLFGAAAGAASLLLFPSHLVKGESLRMVNLLVTPIAVLPGRL